MGLWEEDQRAETGMQVGLLQRSHPAPRSLSLAASEQLLVLLHSVREGSLHS